MEKNLNRYGYDDDGIGIITEKQQLLDNQKKTDGRQNKRLNKLEEGTVIETTYSELVEKRDNGELTPGYFYRITDYECTTTIEDTQSVGHSFDIIVQATSESALNENAKAANNQNDTYFRSANANLDAWELKYCIDNDTDRFEWADEDGKGVVYYMKDEWNNECPYDFKNIQFKRYKITGCPKSPDLVGKYSCKGIDGITLNQNNPYWVYTFTVIDTNEDDIVDVSTLQRKYMNDDGSYSLVENNKIGDYYNSVGYPCIMSLPDNVFVTDTDLIDDYGGFNSYYSNTFGNGCGSNTFGNDCYYNTFGNTCTYNTFGNNCYRNTFGNDCYQNTFGNDCGSNTFGNYCQRNTFGNYCQRNTFGNDCQSNTFGNNCQSNTFGNTCTYNTFGNNASSPQSHFRWIIFDNGNQYINLSCTDDLSSSSYCQNVHVLQGVNNSTTRKNIEIDVANQSYQMFVGSKNNGVIVVYNPADLNT